MVNSGCVVVVVFGVCGGKVGAWNTHIKYLRHLGKVEVGLVSVETLQLGCVLIFAFFCHMTPEMGLLLGLRNVKVGVSHLSGSDPTPPQPLSLPQTPQAPSPHQPWWH